MTALKDRVEAVAVPLATVTAIFVEHAHQGLTLSPEQVGDVASLLIRVLQRLLDLRSEEEVS